MPLNINNQFKGTKADTLKFLKSRLTRSEICDMIAFSVQDWQDKSRELIGELRSFFDTRHVIVRSSAIDEDSPELAMAGYYRSVADVPADDAGALNAAIEKVIASYNRTDGLDYPKCQVLVQPMISDVSMSGVIFTQDLSTGAPYYVINYDDESGRTDTITGGHDAPNKTLLVFRKAIDKVRSKRIRLLLEAVREIEAVTGFDTLDIEFAETNHDKIYIFQVRPMTTDANWNRSISLEIEDAINQVSEFVRSKQSAIPGIYGSKSIFGQMPDWNPAEMIGSAPRPLALSLYKHLITDSTWSTARSQMGYADPKAPLMVSLCGQPYIDVRLSFHSFLPDGLGPDISNKIVNAALDRLSKNPELHDKIEFDVAITSFDFDFEEKAVKFMPGILESSELSLFRKALLELTDNFLSGRVARISTELEKIAELEKQRKAILSQEGPHGPATVDRLLKGCIAKGTIPFSILARHAFVAKSILNSLITAGILNESEIEELQRSIPTVATDLVRDADSVRLKTISYEEFLLRYGHLRPGTYDILSLRYDQRPSFISSGPEQCAASPHDRSFSITDTQKSKIDRLMKESGFSSGADDLFSYIKSSIQAREYAKFVFTRVISDALEIIAQWGAGLGLSRAELSFLTIDDILGTGADTGGRTLEHELRPRSQKREAAYEITKALRFPHLIINPEGVMAGPLMRCQPNFITRNNVHAPSVFLTGRANPPPEITEKIVIIESADPGFDWIFSQNIAGLITKFGGANSHMAIRCAELGIPAAIGCGTQIFDRLLKARTVELDCSKGQIELAWG